ncbi:ATP synthase F1 subunit delta [Gemmatimonas aurantiaca]|nr:ATP synthase F1 subunit delta [Gemmatimonas aurantiaca]
MLGKEVSIRYAQALFASAKERGYLDQADEQLGALQTVFEKDRSLVNYLVAPQVTDEQKEKVIRNIFGEKFERGILEFFLLIARKRREAFIPDIIDAFRELVSEERGFVRAVATSAHPLHPADKERMVAELKVKFGKDVEIVERIDKRTLGGVRVRVKDEALDGTVAHWLSQLRDRLEAVEV